MSTSKRIGIVFDADPDLDPTPVLMSIQIRILPQVFYILEIRNSLFFTFIHSSGSKDLFIFKYFKRHFEIFWKK